MSLLSVSALSDVIIRFKIFDTLFLLVENFERVDVYDNNTYNSDAWIVWLILELLDCDE